MSNNDTYQNSAPSAVNHAPTVSGEWGPVPQSPRDKIKDLITWTARAHGVTFDLVMSRTRVRHVAHARRACIVAVHLARPDLSYVRLGRIFGLDHSTIMHALQQAGAYTEGHWLRRNREMHACEAVARFLRDLRHHMRGIV